MATGTGARQTAPAFHDSFSLRGAPVSGGVSEEVWHSGNCEKSIAGAIAGGAKACAPRAPSGAAKAAARPAWSRCRRLKFDLRLLSSSFIDLGSGAGQALRPLRKRLAL